MGWSLLLSLLPTEALPLIFVGGGMALILGLVSRQALASFLLLSVLLALATPFLDAIFGGLHPGLQFLLLGLFILALFRSLFTLLLGKGAADHLVGNLAYDLLRLPFRLLWGILALFRFRNP